MIELPMGWFGVLIGFALIGLAYTLLMAWELYNWWEN